MPAFLALALLIGALACVFALQNAVPVSVAFLAWRYEASMALVMLATFALGAAVGLLACLPSLVKNTLATRELKRKLQERETPSPEKPKPEQKTTPAGGRQ
ncbi:MAG: LapA family protein [Elusimicrobiota bacterium]